MQNPILRKVWSKYFSFDWKLGIFLIVVFTALRFIIALNNVVHGGSSTIFLLYLSMWLIPVILLTSEGRKYIGIRKPDKWIKLLYALIVGIAFCLVSYLVMYWLYNLSIDNCFVYMSKVFGLTSEMLETYRYKLFFIALIVGMTFSPVGEELLYRGLIEGCFVKIYGENKAAVIAGLAFMIAHLPHFGIIYNAGQWSFSFFPALLWMLSMFMLSLLLSKFKLYSKSIWAAVLAHAGYNAGMMYVTYFLIY